MGEIKMLNKIDDYDVISREIYLPVFPLIAKEALDEYGKNEGRCLDVGCGGGLFGYFIVLLSEMQVTFLDSNPEAIEICRKRGTDWGLDDRCGYMVSDVHNMKDFADNSFDLVVSRGSIVFWGEGEELVQAFHEIRRILAPGGLAMIGGSLGTPRMREAITSKMKSKNPDWRPPESSCGGCVSGYDRKHQILLDAGIQNTAKVDDKGHWILLRK